MNTEQNREDQIGIDPIPDEENKKRTSQEENAEEEEINDLNEIRASDDIGEPDPEDGDLAPTSEPEPDDLTGGEGK